MNEAFAIYKNGDEMAPFYYKNEEELNTWNVTGKCKVMARDDQDGETCIHFSLDMNAQMPKDTKIRIDDNNVVNINTHSVADITQLKFMLKQVLGEVDKAEKVYDRSKSELFFDYTQEGDREND